MLGLPKWIVVFDLECTTWEGAAARNWSGPDEHREVVQVGAEVLETSGLNAFVFPWDSAKYLVKPTINPVLSQYFVELTHIVQKEVNEKGTDFQVFLQLFSRFCKDYELYCFDSRVDGSRLFDRDVLVENCELLGIEFPFRTERFHNVNEIFHRHGYAVKQSGAAPEAFGLQIPARPHDALNDVEGLRIALKELYNIELEKEIIAFEKRRKIDENWNQRIRS